MLQARLIEDILDVSRIISGKLEIEHAPVLLSPLIDTVVSGTMPAAQAKNIELVKTVPADLPVIDGDAKRLHQVLGNVLSNAVKFTPGGGRIDVRCAYTRTMPSSSKCRTRAPASRPSSCPTSSIGSARRTAARFAATAVSASASPSPAT